MKDLFKSLWSDESGQGLTEYALIIALVALGLIAILYIFRDAIGELFSTASDTLDEAPGDQY